ncbi:hypothetical protein VNO77_44655 [Canavalia gladiata]|uniref:Uncharacterized protein n=1 Tax=Canavalia gladiata TaxID=3824 RepID=A0AAN9JWB0_CANGL
MADFIKISSVVQNQKNAYLHLFISKCFDCCWTLAITSYQNYRCRGLGLKLLSLAKQDYRAEVVINVAKGKLLNSLNALRHKACSGDIIFQAAKGPELKLLGLLFRKLRKRSVLTTHIKNRHQESQKAMYLVAKVATNYEPEPCISSCTWGSSFSSNGHADSRPKVCSCSNQWQPSQQPAM